MKRRFCSLLALTVSASPAVAGGAASAAPQLDLRANLGFDSNVFNVNDTIGERNGMFTDLEAGFGAFQEGRSGGRFGMDLGIAARVFESGVSDGDEEKYFVRVRGDSGGKRREHALEWALRYRMRDTTYVSRFTGAVATDDGTSTGNEIGDRYDSAIADLRGGWHLPGGDYGRLSLEGSVETKDYRNDYAAFGLDRLDYNEFGLEPRFESGDRAHTFRIGLPLGLRQYRDRRVSDANGNPVAGTDLEYRYYGVDARYDHEFTRASALELSGGYEIRRDNGTGFGDRTRWSTGVEWTYRTVKKTRLSTGFEWSSRTLNNTAATDPTVVDEAPDKKGYTLDVKFATPFPGVQTRGFSLLAEAKWESFDNSNDVRFSYDRLEAFAGVRKEF